MAAGFNTRNTTLWLVFLTGCNGGNDLGERPNDPPARSIQTSAGSMSATPALFIPAQTASYVAKVKNWMTGLPPTAEEVALVHTGGTAALRNLIKTWQTWPQYHDKMILFFAQAFQQNAVSYDDLANTSFPLGFETNETLRLQGNLAESFGRTAVAIVEQGQPFNQVFTTKRFMMTTPLMVYYSILDSGSQQYLNGPYNDLLAQQNPNFSFKVETAQGPLPLSSTLDPLSPQYMQWYNADVSSVYPSVCPKSDPLTISASNTYPHDTGLSLTSILGRVIFGEGPIYVAAQAICGSGIETPQFNPDEYETWRWVNIRQPRSNESTSRFYDIVSLRQASELVLATPYVGFFTPAFFAHWNTNLSNQARVTTNQTLIVALGLTFDGTSRATAGMDLRAIDANHAAPGTACYACHQTLDPMRQFFLHDYTLSFSKQTDTHVLPGWFDVAGVSLPGTSISDLADDLAQHPLLAKAWTQKLCSAVNSVPCDETNPNFVAAAQAFVDSNYNWNALVIDLLSSPLITFAQPSTAEVVSIARQTDLCFKLSARLGIADICSLQPNLYYEPIFQFADALPKEQYSRGTLMPSRLTQPDFFYQGAATSLCTMIADKVVDAGTPSRYNSTNAASAIADIVNHVMGVPVGADAVPLAILSKHYADALAQGAPATDALKSTFILGCTAPSVLGVGISADN